MNSSEEKLLLSCLSDYKCASIGMGYYKTKEKGLKGNDHPTYIVEASCKSSTIIFMNGNIIPSHSDDILYVAKLCFKYLNKYVSKAYSIDEGLKFYDIYKKIPMDNVCDKLVKNIYRILKVIRNADEHSEEIDIRDNSIFIDYAYGQNHFHLDISNSMLENIFKALSGLMKGDNIEGRNSTYSLGFISWYYIIIQPGKELILSDEFGQAKPDNEVEEYSERKNKYLGETLVLEPIREHIYKNVVYKIQENVLEILTQKKKTEKTDYSITYNNKSYIIPEEALDEKNQIQLDELKKWCIN